MSVATIEAWTSADHALSDTATTWLSEATPANTRRAYTWAWGQFTTWCADHHRASLPATAETLAEYVAHLRTRTASVATIDQALGVILARHDEAAAPKPNTRTARHLVLGYRRHLAENGVTVKQAPPIDEDSLRQVVASLDLRTVRGRRDQLLFSLGFAMMARRSELAALTFADVQDGRDGLDVTVRVSKTDKHSKGRVTSLPPLRRSELDPVALFRAWRAERGGEGPVLCHLNLTGLPAGPITGHGINHAVRAAARRAGLADFGRYTAHSLRAGGLTDALRRQVPIGVAARHGGWDPESPTVLRYARVADRWRDNAMSGAFSGE